MGVSISLGVEVGYTVTESELEKIFGETIPEKSHYEDRFSPTTGEKLAPRLVIEAEEFTVFKLDGKAYGTAETLATALAKKLGGAKLTISSDSYSDSDDTLFIFGLGHGISECDARCPENDEIDLDKVLDSMVIYHTLQNRLLELGLKKSLKIVHYYNAG